MDSPQPSLSPQLRSLPPLLISMIGIIVTAMALLIYHFIVSKYCVHRHHTTSMPSVASDRGMKKGVEEKVLMSIPIHVYNSNHKGLFQLAQIECAVCLGELEESDPVRLLPVCRHIFHLECIDEWFASHSTCPVCRLDIAAPTSPQLALQVDDEEEVPEACNQPDAVAEASNSQSSSKAIVHRCASLLSTLERNSPSLSARVRRSLSMGGYPESVKKSTDLELGSPSAVAAYADADADASSWRRGSFKWLDHGSLKLTKSFSRFGICQGEPSNRILPQESER